MEANSTLLAYYGDDLTGSTDVMEALASQDVDTVLFLKIPDDELFSRFRDCRAFGLAGTSRSETPEWMEKHLVPAFFWLKSLNAAIVHYKVCSTFDSSPKIGNIGKAIEIGRDIFGAQTVPLVVGAPQIRRYTAFGNLFAAYGAEIFRIDRHPVMSRHPVTPMDEADLRLHLAAQTSLRTGLVNLAQLRSPQADSLVDAAFAGDEEIILLDVDGDETQQLAGAQIWRKRDPAGQFTCGSSGVEYALMREWRRLSIAGTPQDFPSPGPVDQLAVVSGSVSPTTESQIRHALDNGFRGIALDPLEISAENADAVVVKAVKQALEIVGSGESVILYTALGPSTNRGDAISFSDNSRHRLGENLGNILREIVVSAGLKRAVIAGGDTSSHALAKLGVAALTLRLPLPQTPGSPLCTAYSSDPRIDGMLVALKGGQVGGDDYFSMIRDGGPSSA